MDFTITVRLDWLEVDEEGGVSVDNEVRRLIIEEVVNSVSASVKKQFESAALKILEDAEKTMRNQISDRMNVMMEEFFNTPRNITDRWGNITREGFCVKAALAEACDNFLVETVDNANGKPTSSTYNSSQRIDYIIRRVMGQDVEWAVKSAVIEAEKRVKKIAEDELKKRIGERAVEVLGVKEMINNA